MAAKSIRELMIVWTPKENGQPGIIKIGPWPDYDNRLEPYDYSAGACYFFVQQGDLKTRTKHVFDVFRLVVRDGVPVEEAHRVFMQIEEYRKAMPRNLRHLLNLNCAPGKQSSGPSQKATLQKAA